MAYFKATPKYVEARDTLPEELRPIYDRLVEEYFLHTHATYGHGYVAYRVIAALVRDGWRPSAGPRTEEPRS